jgi:hypothetical protein
LCIYNGQLTVMRGTLDEMKRSGEQSTEQVWRAIDNINWEARSMDGSVKQAQEAMSKSEAQAKTAFDASIAAAQLDQRAWVGVIDTRTIGGEQTPDRKMFSFEGVQIPIRNSGKTPAINLSAVILLTSADSREKIGDYDSFTTEYRRRREEFSERSVSEMIQHNPQAAEAIRARDKEMKATEAQRANDLFPARQVLAPGVTITHGVSGAKYQTGGITDIVRFTVYILGKITYNDIFNGTPKHTTKFCLMREFGMQFVPCLTGNSMD